MLALEPKNAAGTKSFTRLAKRSTFLLLAGAVLLSPTVGATRNVAETGLIPRGLLFASPTYSEVQISPDGRQIAYLHPLNGVANVWVAPIDDPANGKVVTRFDTRPPDGFRWSPDGRFILVMKDVGGEEHSQLWVVNLAKQSIVNVTGDPDVQTKIVKTSARHPGEVLIGLNIRDKRYRDIYRVDLETGARTEVFRNNANYIDVFADADFNINLGVRGNADGSSTYFRLGADGPSELMTIPLASLRNSRVMGLDGKGKLTMLDSRGVDKANLVSIDTLTGAKTVIADAKRADIVETVFDDKTNALLATREDPLVGEWTVRSESAQAEFAALKAAVPGSFTIADQSPDGKRWLLLEAAPGHPDRYLWWDRAERRATPLFSTRPELDRRTLGRRIPVAIKSRDGLTLPSYLTLPPRAKLRADGMPEKPLPLVLIVHGGPWLRDDLSFDAQHAWLADRGYAVMSVNFRGSSGFGSAFMAAADKQWSGPMHNDLLDSVAWAIEKGVTAKDRVAVMGLSYGGYSTMVSLSFTPDTFQCGVNLAGPSNLPRQIADMPVWWTWQKPQFVNRVGDPYTADGAADLLRRSPISRVDAITKPVLITFGANDPRVYPFQGDEMVEALVGRGKPVTYAIYPDEGHSYAKDLSNISFAAVAEHFLSKCLGGPAEPFGRDLSNSRINIRTGAQFVPGLEEALKKDSAGKEIGK